MILIMLLNYVRKNYEVIILNFKDKKKTISNLFVLDDTEDAKRVALETQIMDLNECLEMTERDSELIKSVRK